jgi:hypothetical protein
LGEVKKPPVPGTATEVKKIPPPRLASIARNFMKRRAYTVSSPTLPPDLETKGSENPPGSKLDRRKTFIEGQPSPKMESRQLITPISEHQLMRLDSKPDYMRAEERLLRMEKMENKPERPNSERRRSILVAAPPIRPSWPDRRSILMARERLKDEPAKPANEVAKVVSKYVDAEVQTEPDETEFGQDMFSMETASLTQHSISIGFMSDFFRGEHQYQLGDALQYV